MKPRGSERNLSDRVRGALAAVGARLKRDTKHLVYELPNGNKVTVAATPSDHRADLNQIRDIRKAAGVEREVKPPSKPRAHKPGRVEPESWGLPRESSPMAAALRQTGLVEQQLRSQVWKLECDVEQLRREVHARDAQIAELNALWPLRLYRWCQVWM